MPQEIVSNIIAIHKLDHFLNQFLNLLHYVAHAHDVLFIYFSHCSHYCKFCMNYLLHDHVLPTKWTKVVTGLANWPHNL